MGQSERDKQRDRQSRTKRRGNGTEVERKIGKRQKEGKRQREREGEKA
jgi:hypothetical protein